MKKTRLALIAVFIVLFSLSARAQTPPPNELERAVALMAKVGACWSPSFSPDGRKLAFISNMSGVPQVYVMPAAGGFPAQVTALDGSGGRSNVVAGR